MQIKLTEQGSKTCAQTNQFNNEYFKTVLEELPEEKQKQTIRRNKN